MSDTERTVGDLAPESTGEQSSAGAHHRALDQIDITDSARKKRRRGSRGGRNRKRPTGAQTTSSAGQSEEAADPGNTGSGAPAQRRASTGSLDPTTASDVASNGAASAGRPRIGDSRPAQAGVTGESGSGNGSGASATASSSTTAAPGSTESGSGTASAAKKKRKRKKRTAGGGAGAVAGGQVAAGSALTPVVVATNPTAEPRRKPARDSEARSGRERNGRAVGRYMMCVHVDGDVTQISVVEGRKLVEHYVYRAADDKTQIDGNIYLGKVQNVLPGMEAAFIDIGTPKNAVLYRGDVKYDPDDIDGHLQSSARIEDILRNRQSVLCQVTKNPIGLKGARLTQEISLPGRFVVLVLERPKASGISKRLPDDERRRLRKILDGLRLDRHGIIVRTAAEGATADELRADIERLLSLAAQITEAAAKHRAPQLLYKEPSLPVRLIREEFNRNYRGVMIDDKALWKEIRDYVAAITPELADRAEFYDTSVEPLPLLERFHVHEQLHKAVDRKVWLPSGGSLIIERTEALTVIDVNTGRNVGSSNLEETVYRNNLEAADEVAHQLRLRDIGGIIVIDFIDMEIRDNRDKVIKAFRDALSRDKTKTQVYEISELGLVQMTRKRISEGLVESLSTSCPSCDGRGILIDSDLLDA